MTDNRPRALAPLAPAITAASRLAERTLAELGARSGVLGTNALNGADPDSMLSERHLIHVARRLRELATDPGDGEFVIFSVVGRQVFVQFAAGERARTDSERQHLLQLGWQESTPTEGHCGNFWREWKTPVDDRLIAEFTVRTLEVGYGFSPREGLEATDANGRTSLS